MKSIAVICSLFIATLLLFGVSFAVPAAMAQQPSSHRYDAHPVVLTDQGASVTFEIQPTAMPPDIPIVAAIAPLNFELVLTKGKACAVFGFGFDPIDPGRMS